MVLPLIPLLIGGTVANAAISGISSLIKKKKKTKGAYQTGGHYKRVDIIVEDVRRELIVGESESIGKINHRLSS